jgi:hypothetical protein
LISFRISANRLLLERLKSLIQTKQGDKKAAIETAEVSLVASEAAGKTMLK